MFSWEGITPSAMLHDVLPATVLMFWVIFVVYFVSKWVYDLAVKKGYPPMSATYFGRKTIHILAAGIVAALIPFTFKEPVIPLVMALLLTVAVYVPHKTGKLFTWFQDPGNTYEVHFTLMWGLVIFLTWFLDRSFLLGVIPVLFMAVGDGVTEIVRNLRYRERAKAWEGSAAMLLTSAPLGMFLGWAGVLAAILSTLAERQKHLDDNIAVPVVALSVLVMAHMLAPAILRSLWLILC
ncbi:MAG TPA: dolichol kinase [Thermoprotei archaeon]|nr:dolichol kinase [Thermoprotei archaeon]